MDYQDGSILNELMKQLSSDIGNSKSARVIVPICHIYLEHMMTLLLEKNISPGEFETLNNDKNFGFYHKLNKLKKLSLLSVQEYDDLELINKTRNDFAHEFKPDLEEISKRIFKMNFHVFNEKRNPVDAILYDIIQLMEHLERKVINSPIQEKELPLQHKTLQYCKQQFWLL